MNERSRSFVVGLLAIFLSAVASGAIVFFVSMPSFPDENRLPPETTRPRVTLPQDLGGVLVPASETNKPLEVTLEQLVSNPYRYNGKFVSVSGILELEESFLYDDIEALNSRDTDKAVRLVWPIPPKYVFLNKKLVKIEGIVDPGIGHGDVPSLQDIRSIKEATPPSKAKPARAPAKKLK